jgi:hypothetical protein
VSDAEGQILGRRAMRAPWNDCRLLDDQLALIIALAIDPGEDVPWDAGPGFGPAQAEGAAQLGAPLETGAPRADDAAAQVSPRSPPAPTRPAYHLGFAMGYGQVPGPGAGVVLGVREWPQALPLVLEATLWMPSTPGLAETAGAIRYWHADVGAQACPLRTGGSDVSLDLCAGMRVAMTTARARGFRDNVGATRWDVAPAVSFRFHWWITERLGLAIDLGAAVPLPRHTFVYLDGGAQEHTAFRGPPVRLWGGIGLMGRP